MRFQVRNRKTCIIPALTSHGGEFGERSDLVKDARLRRAPPLAVLRILDKIGAVSPMLLAIGCKDELGPRRRRQACSGRPSFCHPQRREQQRADRELRRERSA
jgi:hypothetical protein